MEPTIRPATTADAPQIAEIYNHYVTNSYVTFETDPVAESDMAGRIRETLEIPLPWLVAEDRSTVLGYAYASKWKGRCAYRFSVEATVYLDAEQTGHGLGTRLYSALIGCIRDLSIHAVIGGIALPNEASVGLHEHLGFKKVAHFEQVGFKQNRWIDVGYWQLLL